MRDINFSRKLRKNQTPWEAKLWELLRDRRFQHLKFRRQHKLGRYIVDFYCPEKRLVIELDGGQHNEQRVSVADQKRQAHLESMGCKVLRFWNNELDENIFGVFQKILANL